MSASVITITMSLIVFSHVRPSQQYVYRISPYVLENSDRMCPTEEIFQTVRGNITSEVKTALNPCRAEDGWRKITDIDMSDNNQNCPQGLTLYTTPFRLCGRTLNTTYEFCEGTTFGVVGTSYSRVCGRITGYQVNKGYAFTGRTDLEQSYVDGVSLTHGAAGSRQHIWTFAIGYDNINADAARCPVNGSGLPSFITNDYFCDSGNTPGSTQSNRVYNANPLWDGVGCYGDPYMPQRCYVNNPPWFQKVLPRATTDDIELRICGYSTIRWGDTHVQKIELYVK